MRGVKGRKQLVRKPEDINLRGRQDGRRGRLIKHGITAAKVCVNVCVYMSVCLPGGLLVSLGEEGEKSSWVSLSTLAKTNLMLQIKNAHIS